MRTLERKEINRQIDEMLETKLIILSQVTHYSQVLLTPKPNKQWRFCIDLQNLNRVPIWLKGATSYYQMIFATVVITGLIHLIIRLYIDDLILHGPTEAEFIKLLSTVFEHKFKITLNPAKRRFDMDQIEHVGHIIDPTGLSFLQDKRDKVRNFPLPMQAKHLRSFIGLVNYFRDHTANH